LTDVTGRPDQEAEMLERQVVIPASPEQLWDALTDPGELAAWFGSEVDWDLRPGGRARFKESDGTVRRGLVDTVFPGRHLSFRWWPEDDGDQETSRVTYTLEPDDEGTRLTVTEQPVPARPGESGPAVAATGPSASIGNAGSGGLWTGWDSRLLRCWARAGAVAMARGADR
jgi:uncharacterized protein YndB with AHSA1/START domain